MININKDILILSIFIVALGYFLDRIYIDTEMYGTPYVTYDKLEKIANTGDLVIFRWNMVDVGYRLFSKHSHAGMIVRKKNKLYLLETHPKENLESEIDDSGVHLYHLEKRLREYNGDYYYSQINISNQRRNKLTNYIFKNLNKFKRNIPFDTNFRNTFVLNYFLNLLNIPLYKRKGMFCSEFLATILQKNDIYHHHKNLASINPGTFLEFKKLNGENLFSQLYQIIISC